MTRDELATVLAYMPSFERAQAAAAFGADWTPARVADELLAGHFPRYLLEDSGDPLAAGGLFPKGGGVWEGWVFASRECRRRASMESLSRVCRNGIAWAFAHGAYRIEAFHLADQPRVHAWLESLGLKRAQELPRYGRGGEDFVRFEVTA